MWSDRKSWAEERGLLCLIRIPPLSWKPKSPMCHHWSICSNPLCLGTGAASTGTDQTLCSRNQQGAQTHTVVGVNMKTSPGTFSSQLPSQLWSYQEKTAGKTFVVNTPRTVFPPKLPLNIHLLNSRVQRKAFRYIPARWMTQIITERLNYLSLTDLAALTAFQRSVHKGGQCHPTQDNSHTTIPPKRWKMLRRSW